MTCQHCNGSGLDPMIPRLSPEYGKPCPACEHLQGNGPDQIDPVIPTRNSLLDFHFSLYLGRDVRDFNNPSDDFTQIDPSGVR